MIPSTFSRKTSRGLHCLMPSSMYGKRCRGSSVDFFLLLLQTENGWQGNPPDRMSTHPRNFLNGNVLRFVHTGGGRISFASILATMFAIGKISTSQWAISMQFGRTLLSPIPIPSYPLHRDRCLIGSLVVSTLYSYLLFFMWRMISSGSLDSFSIGFSFSRGRRSCASTSTLPPFKVR